MAGLIITKILKKRLLHGECVNMFLIGEYLAKLQARTHLCTFFVFYMQVMEEFLITSYCKFTDESSSENILQTATK